MSASEKKKAKPAKKESARKKAKGSSRSKKTVKKTVVEQKKVVPKAKKDVKKKIKHKEAPPKTASPKPVKAKPAKLGPPPSAGVMVRHGELMHGRAARGFSFGELTAAGVPVEAARRNHLSLDLRRRSVVEGNVDSLKTWFKSAKGAHAASHDKAAASEK